MITEPSSSFRSPSDLCRLIEPVARELLGEPNKRLSTKTELRFGTNGSMSIDLTKGTFYSHEDNEGGGVLDLIQRERHLSGTDAFAFMREIGCDVERRVNGRHHEGQRKVVARYSYLDEMGTVLFQVLRWEPKTFTQRRPDPSEPSGWSTKVRGVPQVPYRLPELVEAIAAEHTVFIVEGEKDADNLAKWNVPATCNAGGAGKWPDQLTPFFRDADVVIIPDNDPQSKNRDGSLSFYPAHHPEFPNQPVHPGQDHAELVARRLHGVARRIRVLNLPNLPPKGDVSDWIAAGGTAEQFYALADAAPDWLGYSRLEDDAGVAEQTAAIEPIVAVPYVWKEPEAIPPRQWVYGRRLMLKMVSATVAPGGTGKTSLEIAEALAMVSGKPLLGIMPPWPLRVWLWNLEDPREEAERHIQATAKYYDLTPDDIGDRLCVNCARERPLVIATAMRDKAIIVRPVADSLVAEIQRLGIDVVIVDPFVSSHEVAENDNSAIDMVVKEWGRVADLGNCAVELVHHTRKGEEEITAESSRGGGAFIDACRTVRVVNRMTKEQGEKVGIENHRLHFRTYDDKANKVPPADKSDWYKLTSVDLCNAPPGESDLIGVVRRWAWPDAMAGMTAADFDKVAGAIRAGKWRENVQAKSWVGYAVAKALGMNADNKKDKARIIAMLKAWFASGALIRVEGEDETRRTRVFVEVKED
jgi:hypothetical protein